MKPFLALIAISFINYTFFKVTNNIKFILGSELILAGVYVSARSVKMAGVFQKFFMEYPFVHYFVDKQSVPRETFVKAFGLLLIFLGGIIFVFGPVK